MGEVSGHGTLFCEFKVARDLTSWMPIYKCNTTDLTIRMMFIISRVLPIIGLVAIVPVPMIL